MILNLVILFTFFSTIFAAPTVLTPPTEDDFYSAPIGYEDAEPGEILKIRNTPHPLTSIYFPISIKNSWQVLVRSEDSFGNPNVIATTIMEPYDADPNKVLSYQTFEDSADLDCSPSYGFQQGAPLSTIATQIDMTLIVLALQEGYYVVLPDYEGPKSTFTVGRQSGKATLNSIRATLNSGNFTGIEEDAQVAMWGYSGGSLASGWAAALQPTYAPELKENLIGVALGGFVTNITATAESVDGGLAAGLIPVALTGLANEYNLTDFLFENANQSQINEIKQANQYCLANAVIHYFGDDILTGENPLFPEGFGLLNVPTLHEVVQENCLVSMNKTMVPEIPVFVYHGTLDQIIPIKDVRTTYKNWCDWGIESFEFAEDLLNGHITETIIGAPAAWTWLQKRFNGEAPVKGCQHTTRLENLFYPNVSDSTLDYLNGLINAVNYYKLGDPGVAADSVNITTVENFFMDIWNYF